MLADHAQEAVLEHAGVDELARIGLARAPGREALLDLMVGSLENLRELGSPSGITGPAVRGDRATVQRHLDALHEPARSLYAELVGRLDVLLAGARDPE